MGATPPFQEGGTDLAPFLGFGTAPAPFLGIGTEAPPGWDLVLFTSPRTHRPAPGDAPTEVHPWALNRHRLRANLGASLEQPKPAISGSGTVSQPPGSSSQAAGSYRAEKSDVGLKSDVRKTLFF